MANARLESLASEQALRAAIVNVGKIAYDRGLLTATDGNLSARLAPDRILMTPSGSCKGRMAPEDILLIDLSGAVIAPGTSRRARPSLEAAMHLEAYRQRPDIGGVLHAHPPYCTALTVADIPLRADVLPEVLATLGSVPTSDFGMPGTQEGAEVIRPFIRDRDVILLRQHGAVAVGSDLEKALISLERAEHAATVIILATLLGRVNPLPAGAEDRLLAMYVTARTRPTDGE